MAFAPDSYVDGFISVYTTRKKKEVQMPYLQLDINGHYSVEQKDRLAKRLRDTYSDLMNVDVRRISVGIRSSAKVVSGAWSMALIRSPFRY